MVLYGAAWPPTIGYRLNISSVSSKQLVIACKVSSVLQCMYTVIACYGKQEPEALCVRI